MKKTLFTCYLAIICFNLWAQIEFNTAPKTQNSPFYLPPKRATVSDANFATYSKILTQNHAKEKTYEQFEGMFTTRIPYHAFYWGMALSYSNLGEPADSVFYYFEKALTFDSAKTCSTFELYHTQIVLQGKKNWRELDSVRFDDYNKKCAACLKKFRDSIATLRNEVEKDSTLNHALITEISLMMKEDQMYRRQMNGVKDKIELDKLWALQTAIDEKNQGKLATIFDKYGYPTKKMVSRFHISTAAIILLHMPSKFQRQYFPTMAQAFKDKEVSIMDMTMLLDKIFVGDMGVQIFGTQGGNTPRMDISKSTKILKDMNLPTLIKEL